MSKTKRQLRAEAVERLRSMDDWCDGMAIGADYVKALLWDLKVVSQDSVRDALIDLLTDDETPEGDAVAILRKAATCTSVNTSVGDVLRYNVPGNEPSAWQTEEGACEALADMIERDYVSREAYEDLRDEFTWTNSFLHRVGKQCGTKDVPSLKAYVEQLEAERNEALEIRDKACGDAATFKAERDEWRAKAEQANDVLTPENGVTQHEDYANDANADTREKLEADAIQLAKNIWHKGMNHANGVREVRHISWQEREIIELLDRQAAITEREFTKRDERVMELFESTSEEYSKQIAELQAKVDELTRENARLSNDELQARSYYERVVEQNAGLRARLRKVREAMA